MNEAPIKFIPDFIDPDLALTYFNRLSTELDWVRMPQTPRSEYWTNTYGREYAYDAFGGKRNYLPQEPHDIIDRVREDIFNETGDRHEGCFLNHYLTGSDALGAHSDDDPGIDHSKSIAVITLYDDIKAKPRNIILYEVLSRDEKGKATLGPPISIDLPHGSLLLMMPGMQDNWLHRIPKAGFVARPRISMTYRGLVAV